MRNFTTRLLLIALLCFAPLPGHAQSDDVQIVAAATAALDEFMRAFNSRDMDDWAASLNYPHVRFASGEVNIYNSAEDFAARKPFENLVRTSWDHSHWISREVSMVSADKVHFNTVFQRFNSQNEVIGTYESLYIVTLVNGHWGTQARSSLAP